MKILCSRMYSYVTCLLKVPITYLVVDVPPAIVIENIYIYITMTLTFYCHELLLKGHLFTRVVEINKTYHYTW